MELVTPQPVQKFNDFIFDSVRRRIELYKKQENIPEHERRQDMFYFLCKAKDPSIGCQRIPKMSFAQRLIYWSSPGPIRRLLASLASSVSHPGAEILSETC